MDEAQKSAKKLDLRAALDFKPVRDLLWELIGQGQVFNQFGPQQSDYLIGMRDLALQIVQKIEEEDPDIWILMLKENRKVNEDGK